MDTYFDARTKVIESFKCNHQDTEIRKWTYKKGVVQFREQCLQCGEALGCAISRSKLPSDYVEVSADAELAEHRKQKIQRALDNIEVQKIERDFEWWYAYETYLKSPEWAERRRKVLKRARGICEGCMEATATQVHHLTYKHVTRELLFELVALCDACHEAAHDDEDDNQAGVTADEIARDALSVAEDNGIADLENPF